MMPIEPGKPAQASKALILAAGKGSRLGQAAEGRPKCLLQIGGEPLVRRQLEALAEAGASPVLIVIGYGADLVREALGNAAEFIENPRFETTNSLHSFFLSREWLTGPAVILNSDVLFHPRVLETLLESGEDGLAYDSLSGHAREHMKVVVRDGRVVHLSKELSEAESSGENVGMIHLGARSLEIVFAEAEKLVAAGRTDAFLSEAIRASLDRITLRAVDIAGIPWIEIDTPSDLDRARRELWPQISERRDGRTRTWKQRRRRRRWGLATALAGALALAFSSAWLMAYRPPAPNWETVAASSRAPQVEVKIDGIAQPWWRLEGVEAVETEIQGPRTVRVELRCLVAAGTRDRLPYVAEIQVDGKRQNWHQFKSSADPRASFGELVVGDRHKILAEIPSGKHTVSVRLLAGDPKALLVRFRVVEAPE